MIVDPATQAVIAGWLQQITDEMDEVLCKSAFSPTISEGHDTAEGIYRATGELIAQNKLGLPIFPEIMQTAVKSVVAVYKQKEGFSEGDVIMMNDPYLGGSHLQDVKFFKPLFRGGKLAYFLANTGHWPDIGGNSPGSFVFGAREILQEGVRILPMKLYDKGRLNEDVLRLLLANVRIPEERLGDLEAQVGALRVGEERLTALLDKYGDETVAACVEELEKSAESYMRSYVSEIPVGVYSETRYIDNDGVVDEPMTISLDLEVRGSELVFDFSKSSPPSKGPMNAPYCLTSSACVVAVRHVFPDIPINSGILKPIKVVAPQSTFLNVSYPKATGAHAQVGFTLIDAAFGALAQAMPEKLWADHFGTINSLGMGGDDSKRGPWVMFVFLGGGYGGWNGGDGLTYGGPASGIARVQPYEVFEQIFPVRVRQFSIREGSGGAGKYRGGFGAIIEMEFLGEEAKLTLMGDRGKFAPRGILGGKDGAKNEFCIIRKNGEKFVFPFLVKGETYVSEGDRIILKTPGGGGYGNPLERERELILKDVVKGFINEEVAKREYNTTIQKEELESVKQTL